MKCPFRSTHNRDTSFSHRTYIVTSKDLCVVLRICRRHSTLVSGAHNPDPEIQLFWATGSQLFRRQSILKSVARRSQAWGVSDVVCQFMKSPSYACYQLIN
jgi:hypothetical protein